MVDCEGVIGGIGGIGGIVCAGVVRGSGRFIDVCRVSLRLYMGHNGEFVRRKERLSGGGGSSARSASTEFDLGHVVVLMIAPSFKSRVEMPALLSLVGSWTWEACRGALPHNPRVRRRGDKVEDRVEWGGEALECRECREGRECRGGRYDKARQDKW